MIGVICSLPHVAAGAGALKAAESYRLKLVRLVRNQLHQPQTPLAPACLVRKENLRNLLRPLDQALPLLDSYDPSEAPP